MRCINLDWVEVRAIECAPRDIYYYRARGIQCEEREYGTRVFGEMFTVYRNGAPFLEIRRKPLTPVLPDGSVHVRLTNNTCYTHTAIADLTSFLSRHGYLNVAITRIDIAMDFLRFDSGDDPGLFMHRYIDGRYSKINQCNINAHGADRWDTRAWQSLSWGSKKSAVFTRFYNKTQELQDVSKGKKTYILQAWRAAGLITDDEFAGGNLPSVWRVEFALSSAVKGWLRIEPNGASMRSPYYSIHHTLDCYATPDRLLTIFSSLSEHYFHFRHYEPGVRKDRCRRKTLFRWSPSECCLSADLTRAKLPTDSEAEEDNFLFKLFSLVQKYHNEHPTETSQAMIEDVRDTIVSRLYSPSADITFSPTKVRDSLHIHPAIAPRYDDECPF